MNVVHTFSRLARATLSRPRNLSVAVLARGTKTTAQRVPGLIAAHRYHSALSALAVVIVLGVLIAHGQGSENASSAAILTAMPTMTGVPTAVPTLAASPTSDLAPSTLTPIATSTDESTATPTTVASPTPASTATATATATQVVLTPTPVAATTAGLRSANPNAPLKLLIPKIGVTASVESVGMDGTGAMATPSGPYTVGWWDLGTVPGNLGNAVIDGHLDSAKVGPAVFWRLGDLRAGDQILVQMPGNHTLTFVVDRTATYPYNQAPLTRIFGPASTPSLNLVTCSGSFDRASKNYNRRLVVYSHLLTTT